MVCEVAYNICAEQALTMLFVIGPNILDLRRKCKGMKTPTYLCIILAYKQSFPTLHTMDTSAGLIILILSQVLSI